MKTQLVPLQNYHIDNKTQKKFKRNLLKAPHGRALIEEVWMNKKNDTMRTGSIDV